MMIPTPFVEFQDEFPEQMYPEVRIERAIGGGVGGAGSSSSSKNNSNNNEVILVESSRNSFRVSVKLKHSDELDAILTKQLSRFMRQRAEQFSIVRKKATNSDAFDLSFLVTQKHKKQFVNSSLVAFMVDFLKSVDGEISEQKLSVSSRGRAVAEEFLGGFC
jgi:actin related protein 2/3 complex subunit 4